MGGHQPFEISFTPRFEEVAALCEELARTDQRNRLPFQDVRWLSRWYAAFAGAGLARPLIAIVCRAGAGSVLRPEDVAMLLPLVRRRRYGLPIVDFADLGVTDYNLPLFGPACPQKDDEIAAIYRLLARALSPFAAFRLGKMPVLTGDGPNPLSRLPGAAPCALKSYQIDLPALREDFLRVTLSKKKRAELRRITNGLEALGSVRFALAKDEAARRRVFDVILRSQRRRIPAKGERYRLEDDGYRQFYEMLAHDVSMADFSVLSAIWIGDEPVIGLLGLRGRDRFVALRIGQCENEEIMRLGIGRLIFAETAGWAIDEGLSVFDFSLGSNALKEWFHPHPSPLVEVRRYAGLGI